MGQWSAPVDPERLYAAIERYERRLVEMALGNAGVSRRESDVRSAMSLAVSRDAQRDAQRAYEPVFRRSDIRLLKLVAGLLRPSGGQVSFKGRDIAGFDALVVGGAVVGGTVGGTVAIQSSP